MQFRILGPLEVQVDEGWSGINAAKWRTVLAVLLLQPGQVVSTDRLITEVWPDDTPNRATNLISVYVHRLRRLIGDPDGKVLTTRAPGYQLLIDAEDIDAGRFAQLTSAGRRRCRPATSSGRPACSARPSACGRAAGRWPTCRPRPWSVPRPAGWRNPASRRYSCTSRLTWAAGGTPRW